MRRCKTPEDNQRKNEWLKLSHLGDVDGDPVQVTAVGKVVLNVDSCTRGQHTTYGLMVLVLPSVLRGASFVVVLVN